ncbi:Catsper1, partial [Symbiodinium microadriaticum]
MGKVASADMWWLRFCTWSRAQLCREPMRDVPFSGDAAMSSAQVFFTLIILANAVFIGVETQYYIDHPDNARWDFFYVTASFTALFVFELIMRILAYGKKVFCSSDDWMWGWLDLTICITSVLQLTDDFSVLTQQDAGESSTNSSVRAFRIIRVARILRAVRVVRVLRFVTALRTLVMSIFHTLKALFWALVLLFLIVYVFATLLL